MEAIECISTRKSIKKFRPEPVPNEILSEVIRTAQQNPSYKNSQPWKFLLISGEKQTSLSKLLIDLLKVVKKLRPTSPNLQVGLTI